MSISSDFSAMRDCCSRANMAATWLSGAMAREASMLQAMSPPMVSRPSEMRYTPQMITVTLTNWVNRMDMVTEMLASPLVWALETALMPTTFSQACCMRPSASDDFTVSSPLMISTSRAFFCMPSL